MLAEPRSPRVALVAVAAVAVLVLGAVGLRVVRRPGEVGESTPAAPVARPRPGVSPPVAHPPQIYQTTPGPHPGLGQPLRTLDIDTFDRIARADYQRQEMLDLFPGRPYHVKLVGSFTDRWIDAVMVDVERDGHFDERWDLKPDGVFRRVIGPGQEFDAATPFMLRNGLWLPD